MKVQLYVPPGGYFAERWSDNMMPALGHLYIAAVLEKAGYDIEVVPSHVLDMDWEAVHAKVARDKPDVLGITTTTENRFLAFELARVVKRASPDTYTIVGGPHFNGTGIDTLEHVPEIDAVCQGEGEFTMLETVQAVEAGKGFGDVGGLVWRDGSELRANCGRSLYPDLTDLPMPARHLEPMEKYGFKMDVPGVGQVPGGNIMTSRGCPFTCTFCATPTNWGRKMRAITPEQVIEEMLLLRDKYGARAIWFYDDTFNYSRKRTMEICDLMEKHEVNMHWWCEIRVDILPREILERMKSVGCFGIGFGVESANARVSRDIITKKATLKQAYDVIEWSNQLGVVPSAFFIFSHPTETWEEASESINVIEDIRDRADASMSLLHVYPGTPLEKRAREEGALPKDFSWSVERDPRIILLPPVQGHAPIYKDRLSWFQICEVMVRFSIAHKKIKYKRKVPAVLASLYSWRDVYRYGVLTLVVMKFRFKNWIGRGLGSGDGSRPVEAMAH